jgi:hypothetical protein
MRTTALAALTLTWLVGCSTASPPISPEHPHGTPIAQGDALKIAGDGSGIDPERGETDWGILDQGYGETVAKVTGMMNDARLSGQVVARGLNLLDVMWEDTGRFHGSSVGPNITDLTLQVRYREPGAEGDSTALMPVIRFPNFTDRTGDIPAKRFFVRVGNERGGSLRTVALTDMLRDIKKFASHPESIGGSGNLLAARDTHFLVSAQAVFLPIPKQGKAEFNPVVFNYQSAPSSPAVLTILVTRQGTSMTVVENRAEDSTIAGHGQELYFNNGGKRASFTAERLSTVQHRIEGQGGPRSDDDRSALKQGADVLFLIQVPLKQDRPARQAWAFDDDAAAESMPSPSAPPSAGAKKSERSDVERAVLGHGRDRGPFLEGRNLKLVRDERFPIRVTVQFYKATSNGVVEPKDLDAIASAIGSVYEHADFVGSLVVPENDPKRPTAWAQTPRGWFTW